MGPKRASVDEYEAGVLRGDRGWIGRAITLVESALPRDSDLADELMLRLSPRAHNSIRVGITGPPGVGKSTFIEALGCHLGDAGQRCAVLAVDPSSRRTGGSILGDKTRMHRLSAHPMAYVRPSPAGLALGGVANRTREAMLICEAAGFEVLLIESVGVGQSETLLAEMVDTLALLALPGAGDELQGIKRGIVEVADLIFVNKADGEQITLARDAAARFSKALRLFESTSSAWTVPVLLVSALNNEGIQKAWEQILRHREGLKQRGELGAKRAEQAVAWMWRLIDWRLMAHFRENPEIAAALPPLQAKLESGKITPELAARRLLARHWNPAATKDKEHQAQEE